MHGTTCIGWGPAWSVKRDDGASRMVRAEAMEHGAAAGIPEVHWQVQFLPSLHSS